MAQRSGMEGAFGVGRKFDRFARSVSHLLRALGTFRVLGVEFVSLSESQSAATEEAMGFFERG